MLIRGYFTFTVTSYLLHNGGSKRPSYLYVAYIDLLEDLLFTTTCAFHRLQIELRGVSWIT